MTELQESRERELSDWERDVEAWNLPRPALTTPRPPSDLSKRSTSRQTEGEEGAQSGSAGA
jgi:hypothetical protein